MTQRRNIIHIKRDDHNWRNRKYLINENALTVYAHLVVNRYKTKVFSTLLICSSLTLGSSVVCGSNALEPLLARSVPPVTDSVSNSTSDSVH